MSQTSRLTRRIIGALSAREVDLQLDAVDDKRTPHLIKWPLHVLLRLGIVWLRAGCKSLAEAEQLTVDMTPDIRHKLKLLRRIPDTTWRTVLIHQDPDQVRNIIHRQELFGPADAHLRLLKNSLNIQITARNGSIILTGEPE